MNKTRIEYHEESIRVEQEGDAHSYRLTYPDGRWMILEKRPDDTHTVSTDNANVSYSLAFVWTLKDKSNEPDWVNPEQLQVIGELIARKEVENNAA